MAVDNPLTGRRLQLPVRADILSEAASAEAVRRFKHWLPSVRSDPRLGVSDTAQVRTGIDLIGAQTVKPTSVSIEWDGAVFIFSFTGAAAQRVFCGFPRVVLSLQSVMLALRVMPDNYCWPISK